MRKHRRRRVPGEFYIDELDRELDHKIDRFFHRWPWKLIRFVRRVLIVVFMIWVASNAIPSAITFVKTQPLGPVVLQLLTTGASLFVFIGFQFALMFFFMARSRIYWVKPGETGVGFKDYKGNPEVLEAASRIVTLLQGVKKFKDMGGEITRGILLIGPPGTGKSYLAQAISTEAGVPFGYLSAPSLTSAWMGMGSVKVMMLYRKARRLAREYGACILFIDEIDSIGTARDHSMMGGGVNYEQLKAATSNVMMGGMGGMGAGSGLLNELLLQMDPPPEEVGQIGKALRWLGLRRKRAELPPVLTIGATNLGYTLDKALLRPGRFDRTILIEEPDADGRREIIEYYLNKVKYDPRMPIERLVRDTIDFTPAAIKYVVNESVIHAHFDGRQEITYSDFTQAREIHEWGLRQPIRHMSYKDKRRLAYHEAGHAYAMIKLYKNKRLIKVTIIRHGSALGLAAPKPMEPSYTATKEEQLEDIQVSLASRAAEQLFLGVELTGVVGDLMQATQRVAQYIGAYGMDNSFVSYQGMGGIAQSVIHNHELKKRMDSILNEQYAKVKRLLEYNQTAVTALAEALILHSELTDIDVDEIVARVEVEHPFVSPEATEYQPFGFYKEKRPQPRNARCSRRNGHSNGQSKEGLSELAAITAQADSADN